MNNKSNFEDIEHYTKRSDKIRQGVKQSEYLDGRIDIAEKTLILNTFSIAHSPRPSPTNIRPASALAQGIGICIYFL